MSLSLLEDLGVKDYITAQGTQAKQKQRLGMYLCSCGAKEVHTNYKVNAGHTIQCTECTYKEILLALKLPSDYILDELDTKWYWFMKNAFDVCPRWRDREMFKNDSYAMGYTPNSILNTTNKKSLELTAYKYSPETTEYLQRK